MLLNAHACQPRLRLAAIAQKGRLVAGHQNWLGLALQPLHDELLGLRVHAAAGPSAAKDPWAASGSGAGNALDSRCGCCATHHRRASLKAGSCGLKQYCHDFIKH